MIYEIYGDAPEIQFEGSYFKIDKDKLTLSIQERMLY